MDNKVIQNPNQNIRLRRLESFSFLEPPTVPTPASAAIPATQAPQNGSFTSSSFFCIFILREDFSELK